MEQLDNGRARLAAIRRDVAKLAGVPYGDVSVLLIPALERGDPLHQSGYYGAKTMVDGVEYAYLVKCRELPSDHEAARRSGIGLAARIAAKTPMSLEECERIVLAEPTE